MTLPSYIRRHREQFRPCDSITSAGQRCQVDAHLRIRDVNGACVWEGWVCGNHYRARHRPDYAPEILERKIAVREPL